MKKRNYILMLLFFIVANVFAYTKYLKISMEATVYELNYPFLRKKNLKSSVWQNIFVSFKSNNMVIIKKVVTVTTIFPRYIQIKKHPMKSIRILMYFFLQALKQGHTDAILMFAKGKFRLDLLSLIKTDGKRKRKLFWSGMYKDVSSFKIRYAKRKKGGLFVIGFVHCSEGREFTQLTLHIKFMKEVPYIIKSYLYN